jgi:hypothetical protein
MQLKQAIDLHCIVGPAGEGKSSFPAHGHPETSFNRDKQRKGGKDKGGVQADSAGTQTTGATGYRKFRVIDRMGRTVNSFNTYEEAKKASDGNRFTKVTPAAGEDQTMRDVIRQHPTQRRINKGVAGQRRSIQEPDVYRLGKV